VWAAALTPCGPCLRAGDGGEARSLRRIFTELGLGEAEANDRAWLAYTFYIGHHQLGRAPQTKALQPTTSTA
jgi:hypothetical protein